MISRCSLLFLGLFFRGVSSSATSVDGSSNSRLVTLGVPLKTNPFDDLHSTERSWQANTLSSCASLATIAYGYALCTHGLEGAKGQIRCMTMFRATGQEKLLQAIEVSKQNIKDAALAAIWRAPSFVMAHRSFKQLDDRIAAQRAAVKRAKADGKITKREAKMLKDKRKQTIRRLQQDMRRMARASINLKQVLKVLDIDEIMDLTKSFFFQLLAVLAADDNNRELGKLGHLVGKWCVLLNLGSLLSEATLKCADPIVCRHEEIKGIKSTSKAVTFATSGYLVLTKNALARRLNAAFLSSAVLMRGVRGFVQTMIDWDDDDDDHNWRQIARALDGFAGGVLLVGFAVSAWRSHSQQRKKQQRDNNEEEDDDPSQRGIQILEELNNENRKEKIARVMKKPLTAVENAIERLADKLHNFI